MPRSRKNAEVPNELVTEILSSLPVKSLLRFKSVCKYWNGLIEEPEFVSKHHQRGKKYFLTSTRTTVSRENTISALRYYWRNPKTPTNLVVASEKIDLTDQLPGNQFQIYYLHNGILCIGLYRNQQEDLHLWNPATKELKALPEPKMETPRPNDGPVWYRDAGFGFDFETNDYKVVTVNFLPRYRVAPDRRFFAEIYSLSSDSWREIDAGNILPSQQFGIVTSNWGLHIDGMHLWLLENYAHCIILSFDFAAEIFTTTIVPPDVSYNLLALRLSETLDYFFVLNGCVAVIIPLSPERSNLGPPKGHYEIWVLNEIGDDESWTKLYKFGLFSNLDLPLGSLKDDELFVKSESGELVWCARWDPNRLKYIKHSYTATRSYAYKESLMKLKS